MPSHTCRKIVSVRAFLLFILTNTWALTSAPPYKDIKCMLGCLRLYALCRLGLEQVIVEFDSSAITEILWRQITSTKYNLF